VWYRYSQKQILPPVHEGCKCYIEQMPGGNTIWQFTGNTCETCKILGREYNQKQNSPANEPALIKPPIPEPPAVIEEPLFNEEKNTQQMNFMNFKYVPRIFYDLKNGQ